MPADDAMTLGTDQLVTFCLDNDELAVPISAVQEIIKQPAICRVPNAPEYLEGIGNLRGKILPIVNLRAKLGRAAKEHDEKTRIVVLNIGGIATGLIVDRVSEVLRIEASCLESPQSNLSGDQGQIVRLVAKIPGRKTLILILDEHKLLPELAGGPGQGQEVAKQAGGEPNAAEDLIQVVTFKIASEEFSLGIMEVKEIIRISGITPVPKAAPDVVGVISLRDQLIPIIDLRSHFSMQTLANEVKSSGQSERIDAQRILIVDLAGAAVGILVDSVSQVLRLERSQTEEPPAILSAGRSREVKGVSKLNGGKRLVMQMDLASLIAPGDLKKFTTPLEDKAMAHEIKHSQSAQGGDEVQLVAFRLAGEEYALPIVKVQEIIKINQITSVPHTKAYIDGIINLRGNVVPVIDLRTRFGIARKADLEQRRIIVVNISGKTNGFIVDSVTEVLRMRKAQIEAAPSSIAGDSGSSFVEGIGKLNDGKRIIVMVNPDKILVEGDHAELTVLKASEAEPETSKTSTQAAA